MGRTIRLRVYFPPAEIATVRARAEAAGVPMSALLREAALRPPRRIPRRRRIVGLAEMDAAGSDLGHAIRCEDGRTPAEAPSLAERLHAAIMALTVETVLEPAPASGRIGNGGIRKPVPPEDRVRPVELMVSPAENGAMRRLAAVYGLALSEFIRRRVLGRPMQAAKPPLEGLPSVRKCAALLGHAASTGAAPRAERLGEEAWQKCLQLEEGTAA
ncbi:MAG: hypothetical protein K6E40_08610 [Desulfovibrio sp.]|nr:hypothetical protein [Desulfovibrio sp.]